MKTELSEKPSTDSSRASQRPSRPPDMDEAAAIRRPFPSSIDQLQEYLLDGVSRTFAPTIRRLPAPLAQTVTNAYLLCRILDTIEDEPNLTLQEKRQYSEHFIDALTGARSATQLASVLQARLSSVTTSAERALIAAMPDVVAFTHRLDPGTRDPVVRCVREMAAGMVEFQARPRPAGSPAGLPVGLRDMPDMDRYCYYVAGVVGVMLTELFCGYSPRIARKQEALRALATSFGQGLQMTNILKDTWDDLERGFCWLPKAVFAEAGFGLNELRSGNTSPAFERGLERLIGIAHGHLRNALAYALLIPREQTGVRDFCLWPIGFAILTLRAINRRRDFRHGNEVKISRRAVRAVVVLTQIFGRYDAIVRMLFWWAGRGIPKASPRSCT